MEHRSGYFHESQYVPVQRIFVCYCFYLLSFTCKYFTHLTFYSSPLIAFNQATAFNADVSKWQTGAVTNMKNTFYKASSFNNDLSKWNTGAVTTLEACEYCY